MKDPHPFMEIPVVRRLIRDLAEVMPQTYGMTVVFVSPELALPADIEKCVSLVDFPLPEEAEMKTLATSLVYNRQNQKKLGRRLTDEEVTAIARACLGLTLDEAENVIAKGIAQPDGTDSGALIQGINGEKKEMLRKAGLEYQEPDITLKDLAGMEVLKDHFARDKKVMMSPKAEELCLEKPKGVLLFGPPGTAKTRFSVAVAGELAQPLVILDLNAMKGSLVGQTETTLRTALARIDAIGHCVVQLDEIEKMFAGSMGASMDSGVSQGILGKMLSWLTSPKRKAYVIMTANRLFDREMSPTVAPEMIRKGRIDEHFFVDLPTADVRAAIFQIHIAKRKRKPRDFDLTKLAEKTEGFSGSEIEQVVSQGIRDAFFENHDLRTEDMVSAAVGTNPLSVTMKEEIERIRNWVVKEKRARSASKPQDAKRRVVTSGTRELL
jgi:ATP-dependent 26S proteasome regulatory subunit